MKTALVLGGGGSKGAFEVGAVMALLEQGYQFDIVTGTSIGALNGAMIAQGDLEQARHLWDTITVQGVMSDGINFEPSLEKMLQQKEQVLPFVKSVLSAGKVDISPLKQLIKQYINPKKLLESPVDFGLVTVGFPQLEPLFLTKGDFAIESVRDWILASASCFPAFPLCEIEGKQYIDGGYFDKLPIDLAFNMGASHVVAIDLNLEKAHPHYQNHPCVTYISPTSDLGSFLYFEQDTIQSNITQGYNDALKCLGLAKGTRYTFKNWDTQEFTTAANQFAYLLVNMEAMCVFPEETVLTKFASDYPLSASLITKPNCTNSDLLLNAMEACMRKMKLELSPIYSAVDALKQIQQTPLFEQIALPNNNRDLKQFLKTHPLDLVLYQMIKEV